MSSDDERRAYNREQKARRRGQIRGQTADRFADTDADKLADILADIADRFADIADRFMSDLARFEERISGATYPPSPKGEGGIGEGAPVRERGHDADNADADNADTTRTDADTDNSWQQPDSTGFVRKSPPLWELDENGDAVPTKCNPNPEIPHAPRFASSPERTAEHDDAAAFGLIQARQSLAENRWHPSKGQDQK